MNEERTVRYSDRFIRALEFAAREHQHQERKGRAVPCIGHVLGVASIVIDNGGTEDEAIAALLHDVAEDQGGIARLPDIEREFGSRVARIVEACSDSLAADPSRKLPWRPRKEAHIRHLRESSDASVYLVSAADKLHNARSLLAQRKRVGESMWNDFKGGRDGSLWNLNALADLFGQAPPDERTRDVADELRNVLSELATEPGHHF